VRELAGREVHDILRSNDGSYLVFIVDATEVGGGFGDFVAYYIEINGDKHYLPDAKPYLENDDEGPGELYFSPFPNHKYLKDIIIKIKSTMYHKNNKEYIDYI
jgi:hypothetical protein